MKKRFKSMPARITAALLTAGLIVSSSNLEYVRFVLPGIHNVSNVEAADSNSINITDENLLKAMEVIVHYKKAFPETDMTNFKGDFTSSTYEAYQKPITLEMAREYDDYANLSLCKNINDLSGLNAFKSITGIDISSYSGKSIPAKTFENCTMLETVIMSNEINAIGASAFLKCTSLSTIEVKGDETNNKIGTLNLVNIDRVDTSAFNAAQRFTNIVFDKSNEDLYLGPAAFSQCTLLSEVDIPTKSSGNLGPSCFSGCQLLVNAKLNDKLNRIPDTFFFGCRLSKMEEFPTNLEEIGKDAFARSHILTPDLSSCNKLNLIDQGAFQLCSFTDNDRQFILPESLKDDEIKRIAFTCSNLKNINIPKNITKIADSTFEGCTELENVIIPNDAKLNSIDTWAFRRCDSLSDTDFISGLKYLESIGDYAFSECYSIKYVPKKDNEGNEVKDSSGYTIMEPVKDEYGVYTLESGIKDITLPDSLTTIGKYCFANNYATETINTDDNLKTIPDYAFAIGVDTANVNSDIAMLKRVNNYELNDLEHLSYVAPQRSVTLSKELTDIGVGAFKSNTNLNTVTYNSVDSVQDGTLVLPSTVVNIGDNAFSDCARWSEIDKDGEKDYKVYGLTKIDLRNLNLDTFGNGVFENDFFLNEAILPANLKVIPERLFNGCGKRSIVYEGDHKVVKASYGLRSVVLPHDVENISKAAFQNCIELYYEGRAFKDSETIEQLTLKEKDRVTDKTITMYKLPSSLKDIEDNAFNGCSRLGKVAFGTGLKSIGEYAFANCSLDKLNPLEGEKAFESGYGLTNISFSLPVGLESIGRSAFEKSAITTASLADNNNLKTINDRTFANCYNLAISEMPWSVTSVGSRVYEYDNDLQEVQLPSKAKISSDIFAEMNEFIVANATLLKITLKTENPDYIIRVPIGQSVDLDFINSTQRNEYHYKQSQDGRDLSSAEEFVNVITGTNKVSLQGEKETSDNSVLKLTNLMTFTELLDGGKHYTVDRDVSESFKLTVTDVYAEKLKISGTGEGGNLDDSSAENIISINSGKITGNDQTNIVEVTASLSPTPRSKAVVWGSSNENVISVEQIDADKELTNDIAKAKIHVKGAGTAKLWVSNGLSGTNEEKDEVTVKIVYPIERIDLSIKSLESDANSFQLEQGKTDVINVSPTYSEEGTKAGSDAQANYFFESTDSTIAAVDRKTGTITTGDKTGNVYINVFDDTGKLLRQLPLEVVEEGKLNPNAIKVNVDKTEINRIDIYKDKSVNVNAVVYPTNVKEENKGIVWTVGDENVALVKVNEDGTAMITGKNLGSTVVYAKSANNNNIVKQIPVSVMVPATTLRFQTSTVQIAVDQSVQLQPTNEEREDATLLYLPSEAIYDTVKWKIDDESIAKFEDLTNRVTLYNGIPVIKGLKQGVTKLTATTGNGLTASIDISVYAPLTDFSVVEKKTMHMGDSFKLDVNKTPADSSEQLKFTSSNNDVATVDSDGNVKAIAEGSAAIYVTNTMGIQRVCSVTIVGKVDQITILDAPIEISVGQTYSISKAYDGENVTTGYRLNPKSTDTPTWSSSNPEIASIEESYGNVTIKGVAPGTATITATTLSGQSASISVTIVSLNTELKFTEESKSIAVGTQAALTISKIPADSTESIKFTSSNEEIAKVDQNGIVTGIAKGQVTITASGKISNVSTSIPVTITVPATGVKVVTHYASEKKIYLVKGSTYQLRYKILPEDSTDKVTYSTNKKKVATISEDGTINAKKKGNATITVKTESGKKATIKVYVVTKEKNAKKIKIKTSSIKVGKTVKLKYTVTAATSTNSVSYSVDKPNIAEIDEYGYITGLKKGKVKVTVTLSNGKTKTKKIKVK